MNTTVQLLLIAGITGLASCKDNKTDETDTVDKAGSVETSVTVQHADSLHDVLITKHRVWENFREYKTIEYHDTIPALATENTTAENEDGDKKNVQVKKDYQIFITVK